MNYQETLDYLFTQLPMFQRIGPAAYKKDLTNTLALCSVLGDPQHKFKSIHIAGTNGKGSVSNMLASVLQESGYSVGLYTSPHLQDFRERIRVNGKMCPESFVVEFTEKMKHSIETIQPSFFEITVAMAFEYFAVCDVDIAVIETGLGGRLDSTNVITPLVSVITNISFDHQALLGNTLPEIAGEKAGIIKKDVPVVIGELHPETMPVFEKKALEMNAAIYVAEENVETELEDHSPESMQMQVAYLGHLIYPELVCDLTGDYQLKNIKSVVQTIELLREAGYEISDEAVYSGLAHVKTNTGFAGRWQVMQRSPFTVCDCAHNTGGLRVLFEQVRKYSFDRLHIVMGSVNDKDVTAALKEYPRQAIYYFTKPAIPRGLDATELMELAGLEGLKGEAFASVSAGLDSARSRAKSNDMILICGSIFVVAEALFILNKN